MPLKKFLFEDYHSVNFDRQERDGVTTRVKLAQATMQYRLLRLPLSGCATGGLAVLYNKKATGGRRRAILL